MDRPLPSSTCRVAILGGGFTGAVVALNLLDRRDNVDITVVEPRALLGAGLAYSAPDPAHRVNVPAIRLLVHPEEPGAFHAWLESSGALEDDMQAELPDGRRYPRRSVFGRYVNQRLMQAVHAPGAPPFRHLQTHAAAIRANGAGYAIALGNGAEQYADVVVLAMSHPAPAVAPPLRGVAGAGKFIADPWATDIAATIQSADRILLIGTALSSADIIASLEAAGYRNNVLAISRRGLVSRQRRLTQSGPFGDFSTHPSRSCVELLQTVRATISAANLSFSCWEAVIESLRNQGDKIWTALPLDERARFLRHLRVYWDVHRYQLAPQLGDILRAKTKRGELNTMAARIQSATYDNHKFHVTLRPRNGGDTTEAFDAIINCTGPDHSRILQTNPALASLAAAGLLRPDPHHLGIDTTPDANPISTTGQATANLFIAGPLARATVGELMGLPQVTDHATCVAHKVAEFARVGL